MKKILWIALVIFFKQTVGITQVREFYDRDGKVVDSVKSYYYTMSRFTASNPLMNFGKTEVDTVLSYYTASGKLKACSVYRGMSLNGPYVGYYENGKMSEKGLYNKGNPVGYFMSWYPDGIPSQRIVLHHSNSR